MTPPIMRSPGRIDTNGGGTPSARRLYFKTSPRDALGIIKNGKLAHKWTRTIIFEYKPKIADGLNLVSLCFKPNDAIRESSLFKGSEGCLAKNEWPFGRDLESLSINSRASCIRFLLATKIMDITLPGSLAIFSGEELVNPTTLLKNTLDYRYSPAGFEALQAAISTYVDFDTIPSEFWGEIPRIIDALIVARIGPMCGNLDISKFDIANTILKNILSGLTPGKHFSGKLPDELIAGLMARTAELVDL